MKQGLNPDRDHEQGGGKPERHVVKCKGRGKR